MLYRLCDWSIRVEAVTYEPNWVGHLVQTVNAERRDTPLLVYDYAVSGDTIARMTSRIESVLTTREMPRR